MSTSKEQLLQMLKALIADNETEAAEIHHQYITTKTAEIAGFKQPEVEQAPEVTPEPEQHQPDPDQDTNYA